MTLHEERRADICRVASWRKVIPGSIWHVQRPWGDHLEGVHGEVGLEVPRHECRLRVSNSEERTRLEACLPGGAADCRGP